MTTEPKPIEIKEIEMPMEAAKPSSIEDVNSIAYKLKERMQRFYERQEEQGE